MSYNVTVHDGRVTEFAPLETSTDFPVTAVYLASRSEVAEFASTGRMASSGDGSRVADVLLVQCETPGLYDAAVFL